MHDKALEKNLCQLAPERFQYFPRELALGAKKESQLDRCRWFPTVSSSYQISSGKDSKVSSSDLLMPLRTPWSCPRKYFSTLKKSSTRQLKDTKLPKDKIPQAEACSRSSNSKIWDLSRKGLYTCYKDLILNLVQVGIFMKWAEALLFKREKPLLCSQLKSLLVKTCNLKKKQSLDSKSLKLFRVATGPSLRLR